MEIRTNNLDGPDRGDERSEERLEGFAASEMADRGPKDVLQHKNSLADTDAAALNPVYNPDDEEGDEDYDDEEGRDELVSDDVDLDDDELDEADFDGEDDELLDDDLDDEDEEDRL